MFLSKKVRIATVTVCVALFVFMGSFSALAASHNYNSVDDIRSKALSKYLSISASASTGVGGSAGFVSENTVSSSKETVVVTETVSYNTIKRLNSSLAAGETVIVREGTNGEKAVTYSVSYENGKETSREVVDSCIITAPVDRIVEYGVENTDASVEIPAGTGTEAAPLNYKYYIDCEATAYDMSPEENGGYAGQSATGVPLEKGVIAVDPKVIPLGTRVYVEALDGSWSYGYAVAADTGGAIKGKRVDLCYRTQKECIQFGRRACRVYILD